MIDLDPSLNSLETVVHINNVRIVCRSVISILQPHSRICLFFLSVPLRSTHSHLVVITIANSVIHGACCMNIMLCYAQVLIRINRFDGEKLEEKVRCLLFR